MRTYAELGVPERLLEAVELRAEENTRAVRVDAALALA